MYCVLLNNLDELVQIKKFFKKKQSLSDFSASETGSGINLWMKSTSQETNSGICFMAWSEAHGASKLHTALRFAAGELKAKGLILSGFVPDQAPSLLEEKHLLHLPVACVRAPGRVDSCNPVLFEELQFDQSLHQWIHESLGEHSPAFSEELLFSAERRPQLDTQEIEWLQTSLKVRLFDSEASLALSACQQLGLPCVYLKSIDPKKMAVLERNSIYGFEEALRALSDKV